MNLEELVPGPSASKVNALAKRVFGYALDLENITEHKAKRLHKNLSAQMNVYESKLGAKAHGTKRYYEMKLALEALSKHLAEREADGFGSSPKPTVRKPVRYDPKDSMPSIMKYAYQPDVTRALRKAAGLSDDAPVYFDDADLVYGDKTVWSRCGIDDNCTFGDAVMVLKKFAKNNPVEEDDVEEDNAFNTAAANAKKAGQSHFSFNGKKYKVKMNDKTADALTNESVVTEGAVESSELVMAAKSMVDKYDAMIQDVGEMLNEELQPVADKIRDEMGSDIADQFVAQMTQALQSTMDVMKNDRMTADGATRILTGDAPAAPMGAEPEGDISADELDMEPTVDQDEFDAAPAAQGGEEAPVGREKRA